MTETYELFAIKYARHDRDATENFVDDPDPHEGNMPIDYFIWVAKNKNRTVLIDTGFNADAAAQRKREFMRCPAESLSMVGANAADIEDIVITHLHYDHVGNFDLFPNARFHLQDKEMQFATGRYMKHGTLRVAYDIEHVVGMVRQVYNNASSFMMATANFFQVSVCTLLAGTPWACSLSPLKPHVAVLFWHQTRRICITICGIRTRTEPSSTSVI